MPRLPIDFSRTQIYRFVCNDTAVQECYVGSTTNWIHRKAAHKSRCNTETDKGYNLKIYQTIRANGGWENWSMVLIEDYPCDNDLEKRKRERYWQEHYDAKMNSRLAQSSMKEWNETHKEYHKEYRESHKEELLQKAKEYRETHKEQIIEKKKEYYEAQKNEINDKRKEKYECECGIKLARGNKSDHEKTKKHLLFISNQQL
jgi:hypothetical protein